MRFEEHPPGVLAPPLTMATPEKLDLAEATQRMTQLVCRKLSFSAAMRALVDWCAEQRPHPDWAPLRDVDFSAELRRLRAWLDDVLSNEPPDTTITGIYFGLFNPTYSGVTTADLYIAGGVVSDGEWLPKVRNHWWPERRYARSKLLAHLYGVAYRSERGLGNDAEYPLALGFAALAAKHLASALPVKNALITAGFDSGDVLTLGRLSKKGLTLSPAW